MYYTLVFIQKSIRKTPLNYCFFKQTLKAFTNCLGCEGNANRYESSEQCERQCGKFKNQDVCSMEKDIGPCMGRFNKYHYDNRNRECKQFTYGGCEGNGNRFSSVKECELICLTREEPEVDSPSTISKDTICKQPVDTGLSTCTDNLERWYYDTRAQTCSAFIYSGCSGNMNRFKTFDVCIGFCESSTPASVSNPMETYRPPPDDLDTNVDSRDSQDRNERPDEFEEQDTDCSSSEERCSALRCPYGTLRYYDDRTKCEECYCNEPCRGFVCPAETSCKVEPYSARGETVYKAVCRDDTKPGICPKVSRTENPSCETECSTDGDCSGDQKCCYNGCGMSCITAAEDPGMVDYQEEEISPTDPNAPIVEVVEPHIFVSEGDVATLNVRVRGSPQPDVYWRKNNRNLDTLRGRFRIIQGGSLQIVGARREDDGRYDCYADNGRGPPISVTLTLTVSEPRDLAASIKETDKNVVMSLGAPATLFCLAYGWPKPTVTWWKGTKILPLSSDRLTQDDDFTLKLNEVSLSDLGPYTCQVNLNT